MGPELESVTCHEDLVKLLAEQFARADVSLRELQARAEKAGGARLPRTTCADMLAGRRFPKKAVMVAFLHGCRVPGHQLPLWERAWERVRVSRLPAGDPADRAVEPSWGSPLATQTAPGSRRTTRTIGRRLVMAVAVPTAAIALGIALVQLLTPQRGGTEAVLDHIADPAQIVSDDGRAFPRGGSSRFTVTVDPANTGIRLTRRLDVGVGLQQATITIDGTGAGQWRPLLEDSVYKWRNQIVVIPANLTAGRHSLTIVNTCVSPSGFNEFRYTVEHRVDGVWSTADTLDVGRDHTASEAAHDYRLHGEDWAGTQTFAYPPREEDRNVR